MWKVIFILLKWFQRPEKIIQIIKSLECANKMHYCSIYVIFIAPKRVSWRSNCATVIVYIRVFMLTCILPSILCMAIKVQLNKYLSLWSSGALLNCALNLILTESYHLFSLGNLMIRSLCLCSLNITLNSWGS